MELEGSAFGSDPLNDIVLPASAPARAGTFEFRNSIVTLKAAPGVTFQLGDKPITTAVLKSDAEGPPDRITLRQVVLLTASRLDFRVLITSSTRP